MLERALPIWLSPIAQQPAIDARVDAKKWLRDIRDRFVALLRFLGEFIAKGGPLS